ncbi:hypothetical protein [Granulicella arctica]|uniref:Uncharacterized protein n=1 Tax=Granulicella arctica TaxID=940613 RepID=A0A7Y9PFT4_9BACT|nr:hypothetical protein [Granulicella arctica]NYF79145.1 hypothetical protein [Granulicella arctica]
MPYIYIDKVLNELRDDLISAMHAAVERELHQGRVDVAKLYRSFNRAASGKVANPVWVSEKCVSETGNSGSKKKKRGTDSDD